MEICNSENCTGCAACVNICPVSAIVMTADAKGFLRPEVDPAKCISCGKCARRCPQRSKPNLAETPKVYAARALEESIRIASSSGGIFSLLAAQVLRSGGVVFGAAYADALTVKHIAVTKLDDLSKLRGSKYVQSEIGDAYFRAKELLDAEIAVLFSGTPCQIAGLKAFLGKEYKMLLTVDILCHGVPSPAVFRKYLNYMEQLLGEPVEDFWFRSKPYGWKEYKSSIQTKSGVRRVVIRDPYMDGFLKNIYLRDSCYHCPYASANRIGDITLGDYWGYQERFPDYLLDDDAGMSLVMVNSNKGMDLFQKIRKKLTLTKRSVEDAQRGNKVLTGSFLQHPQTKQFWDCYNRIDWEQLCVHFSLPKLEFAEVTSVAMQCEENVYWLRQLRHTLGRCGISAMNKLRRK